MPADVRVEFDLGGKRVTGMLLRENAQTIRVMVLGKDGETFPIGRHKTKHNVVILGVSL